MTPSNLHEYNRLMNRVDLPDNVRDAVLREARRDANASNARTRGAATPSSRAWGTSPQGAVARPRRSWVRTAAMGGCAVALAGVLAVGLGATGVLPGLPGANAPTGVGVPATSGNFFTLAAYAAENPDGEPGTPVELSLGAFQPGGASGGGIDPLTGIEGDSSRMDTGFHFDMTCTGENIDSITYELTGDGLYFHWLNVEDFLRAHGVYGDDDPLVKEGYAENYGTTFAVEYNQQNLDENDIQCEIHVPVQMEGELLDLYEKVYVNEEYNDAASNQFWSAVFFQAAEKLAQSTFTMTATFTDGTTQTKSYTIAPVENFAELYSEYMANIEADMPAMFTITEVANA